MPISPLARRALWLKAHHEMGPMRLGERFSFALERDNESVAVAIASGGMIALS